MQAFQDIGLSHELVSCSVVHRLAVVGVKLFDRDRRNAAIHACVLIKFSLHGLSTQVKHAC